MTKLIALSRKSGTELQEGIRKNAELILGTEGREELTKLLERESYETIRMSSERAIQELRGHSPKCYVNGYTKDAFVDLYVNLIEKAREVSDAKRAATKMKEEAKMKKPTVKELREQAKAMGIRGYSRMTKAELEAAVSSGAVIEVEPAVALSNKVLKSGKAKDEEVLEELRKSETREELTAILERYTKKEIKKISSVLIRELQGYCPNFSIKGETKAKVLKLYTGIIMEVKEWITEDIEDYADYEIEVSEIEAAARAEADDVKKVKTASEVREILNRLTKRGIAKVNEILDPEGSKYYEICGITRKQVLEDVTEYIMEDKELAAVEEKPLRRGPVLRRAECADEYVDVEEMKICARNMHKLYKDEWEGELEALNSYELEIVFCELGLSRSPVETDESKRAKIMEYLEENYPDADTYERASLERGEKKREELRKAFEELERGQVFVNIPELRKALNWSREEFDGMLRELRDEEVINLHVTGLTKFEPEEFFYDDDNARIGMVTWNKVKEERLTA